MNTVASMKLNTAPYTYENIEYKYKLMFPPECGDVVPGWATKDIQAPYIGIVYSDSKEEVRECASLLIEQSVHKFASLLEVSVRHDYYTEYMDENTGESVTLRAGDLYALDLKRCNDTEYLDQFWKSF